MTLDQLLAPMRVVESAGQPRAIGDHGHAYGLYQQHAEFRATYSDPTCDALDRESDERRIRNFTAAWLRDNPDGSIGQLLAAYNLGDEGAAEVDWSDPTYWQKYYAHGMTAALLQTPARTLLV